METTLSQRGKLLLVFEKCKFYKCGKTKRGVKWRCGQKNCASKIFTDEAISVIIEKYISHSHPASETLQRQAVSNSIKRKATEDLTEKPSKLIHRELIKDCGALETLNSTDLYNIHCCLPTKCNVSLKNAELWKQFHSLGTEMIITKSGRRMFPSLHVQVTGLLPNALYCVVLEMAPSSHNRFKYSSSGGWFPAGTEEAQSPHRVYLHPASPARGDYWMSQPISFGRLKLTNTIAPPSGQVVLSSMHKYQPRIIIAQASDPREIGWAPSTSVSCPETQFVAVTAYQNEKITKLKITKLKIDNNPFAKGFRETGQARSKRKRVESDENVEEPKIKEIKLDPLPPLKVEEDRLSNYSSTTSPLSSPEFYPKLKDQSKEDRLSPLSSMSPPLSSPELSQKTTPSSCVYKSYNPYQQNKLCSYPYFYPFPAFQSPLWNPNITSIYPQFSYPSIFHQNSMYLSQKEEIREVPRKLTDFSIRAITGCK